MTVLLANAPTRIAQGSSRELFYVKAGSRWPFSIEKATAETARYVPFPFSLAYLAALLEKEKLPVEVLDAVALNLPHSEFVARCTKVRPSILVMEATTPTIEADLALARELKAATGAIIAMTGAHTTVFPLETLRAEESVDWVLKGEYELNALEAIRIQMANGADREERLAQVRGLARATRDASGQRQVADVRPGFPSTTSTRCPSPRATCSRRARRRRCGTTGTASASAGPRCRCTAAAAAPTSAPSASGSP